MKRNALLYLTPLLITYAISAHAQHLADTCTMTKLEVKRLPDMTIPRGGHSVLYVNGELTVVGGHTSGFIPTPTAEYLADGKWHLMETVYAHDDGFSLPTRTGRILLGGGHEKPLGIGQVHHVEWYDPETHTFDGFGCLDIRRVFAQAAELRDGTVAISGNWYHHDSTEVFRQPNQFIPMREVSLQRSFPFIFPTSDGDALIMGNTGTHGEHYGFPTIVDRIYGMPFDAPLLAEWHPAYTQVERRTADLCISDTARGEYAHLILMENREQEYAIILVRDTILSLLPTAMPIPSRGPWGKIAFQTLTVDRKTTHAYAIGRDEKRHIYVFAIDYAALLTPEGRLRPTLPKGKSMPARMYYTDPMPDIGDTPPVLTDEGDIAMTGGIYDNNFTPLSGVCLLCVGHHPACSSLVAGRLVGAGVALLLTALGFLLSRRRRRKLQATDTADAAEEAEETPADSDAPDTLMQGIERLMAEEKLYLRNDLKVGDVADMLGTTHRNISKCITAQPEYNSFAHYVNGLRVEHAKQLLRQHPDMKTSTVGLESGFANEPSFFRTFKSFTGMTPREWVIQGG